MGCGQRYSINSSVWPLFKCILQIPLDLGPLESSDFFQHIFMHVINDIDYWSHLNSWLAVLKNPEKPKNDRTLVGHLPFWELIFLVIQRRVLAYSWPPVLQFGEIWSGHCLEQPFLCLVHFCLILFIHIPTQSLMKYFSFSETSWAR